MNNDKPLMDLVVESETHDAEIQTAWEMVNRAKKPAVQRTPAECEVARRAELEAAVDLAEEKELDAESDLFNFQYGAGTPAQLCAAQIRCCRAEIILARAQIALMNFTGISYHPR